MQIAAIGHPLMAVVVLAAPERPSYGLPSWEWCALIHVGLATIMTMLAALSLRRVARREADSGGTSPAPAPAPANYFPPQTPPALAPLPDSPTASLLPPPLLVAKAARKSISRAVSDNPVLWRETRRPLFLRRWQSIAASSVVIVFLLFIYALMSANHALTEPYAQIPFAFVFCGMLNVLACVLSATAIAQEKESDTWTLLLATPITGRRVVIGKLLGIMRRLAPLCAVIVVHFVLFLLGGAINAMTFLVILYLTFTTNIIWIVTGLFLSLRIKRVTFAVMLNLAGPLVLYAFPALLLAIFFSSTPNENLIEVVGLYCPYPYMASAISHYNSSYDRSLFVPVYGQVQEGQFLLFVLCAGLAHLAVSAAILYVTIRRFDRLVERAPQEAPLQPPVRGLLPAHG